MRTAGGVLGIIGGIFGFLLAGVVLLFGILGVAVGKAANDLNNQISADPTATAALGSDGKQQLADGIKAANDLGAIGGLTTAASGILFILCLVGLIGGIITFFKPPIGAILMAVAAVGGFVIANVFWSFSGFLLGLGAVLAFVGTFSKPAVQAQPAVVPGYYPPAAPPAYPQQGYYPQQQAYPQTQGFPQPNQYGQPAAPQQNYYPQPANQGYPPQGGQQQFYPRPATAPQGQQVVPPQDNTKLN